MAQDYEKGTALSISGTRSLNGFVTELGAEDDGPSDEVFTYWECSGGHIVIHVGHTDTTTMTSVEDGSIDTSIPCGSANTPSRSGWNLEMQGSSFLASVPPDLADRVDLSDATFVVATPMSSAEDSEPVSTIWSTAVCDGGHVVMHYGHEDPNTGTSVYDGAVTTTVSC